MYGKEKMPKMADKGRKSSFESMKDPAHMDAKMSVLEELRDMAMQMMGEKVSPDEIKEVSVAAKSPEGLKEGLEMAKHVLPDDVHDTASAMGAPDSEHYSDDDESQLEELKAMVAEIEARRAAKIRGETVEQE